MTNLKLKDLNGTFNCKAIIHGENVIENRQAIIDKITSQVEAQGGKVELRDNTLYFGNQFYKLPLLNKEREGQITFRSADYVFRWDTKQSFGKKPKSADLTEKGFFITMFNGDKIEYILER